MQSEKDTLRQFAKSKLTTTMIYPLSQFEEYFGEIWGIDKDPSELSLEQIEFRKRWALVRQNILDVGNREIRQISNEINKYDIVLSRKNTLVFKFNENNKEGNK